MEPYFEIGEEEWTYIKENFSEEDIKESLVKILMEYPPPYADISEKDCLKDYQKLKILEKYYLVMVVYWIELMELYLRFFFHTFYLNLFNNEKNYCNTWFNRLNRQINNRYN